MRTYTDSFCSEVRDDLIYKHPFLPWLMISVTRTNVKDARTIPWPCATAHGQGRLALGHRNRGCVDVQFVQGAVRVVPRTVRVVGPRRVGDPPIERQPRIVAVVNVIPGVMRV